MIYILMRFVVRILIFFLLTGCSVYSNGHSLNSKAHNKGHSSNLKGHSFNNELRGSLLNATNQLNKRNVTNQLNKSFLQGADPFILKDNEKSAFIYITNRPGINVPVYQSSDLNNWTLLGDALPVLPSWASKGHTWAPEVIKLAAGKYVLYYTAKDIASGKQCIGRATSVAPSGPFVDNSKQPFLCNNETDTSIDPSPFLDNDGKMYLLWKTKEISDSGQFITKIWIRRLTPDGQIADKNSTVLLVNDLPWEGKHIEAPSLINIHNQYVLFYSAGASTTSGYSISYAVSNSIFGPYKKSNTSLVSRGLYLKGTGHQALYKTGPNSNMIFYHSVHPELKQKKSDHARYIDYSYLCFDGVKPVVQNMKCHVP